MPPAPVVSTVKHLSAPRLRKAPAQKPPPILHQQRKEKLEKRQENQRQIDDAVAEWYAYTLAKADDLGKRFNKKPRYFLDIFFQGGAKMVTHNNKTNAFNAFKSLKAIELNDEGNPTKLKDIQEDYHEEYDALTKEEKDELVEEFNAHKEAGMKIRRPTARARIQDVANVSRNMQLLMTGLTYRVGVEGFFCIVRNSPEYHMKPYWYFTTPALEEYMKVAVRRRWDTSEVGTKLEAFAVAGCDPINLVRTSKQKANHLKREIREKITGMLIEITGNLKAVMQYVNYEEAIIQHYGVELQGWIHDKLVNPSELSSSLPLLRKLLNAIDNGDCKFVKLTAEERRKRLETFKKKIASGEHKIRVRKTRSDAGKRKRKGRESSDECSEDEESDSDDETLHPRKKHSSNQRAPGKSNSMISDSD